ncbi:MAG: hypothetical protein EXS52_00920 [Candidatus Staskawiczbacteria bacterium]|nr:hypothetical protein [Candidatus Staskawiczbacteria bacterium]
MCLAGYSYFSWLMYGISRQDIFLCIPQTLGTLAWSLSFGNFGFIGKNSILI